MNHAPRARSALALAALFAPAACGSDPTPAAATDSGGAADAGADAGDAALPPRGDCNPVDGRHCLLPYPSSFFLEPDPGSPTGVRVAFAPGSVATSISGIPFDPSPWNVKDGFPILGSLYALFPGVSLGGVVGHRNLAAHLAADARTVILDAATGARVAHFVELEAAAAGSDRQLLLLRPVAPMANGTRYVVGIRGLADAAGAALDAPAGFATLRDGAASDDPDLERQRAHYEADVFPVLDRAGWSRADLQLAWDFVTVSEEATIRRAVAMREDALARAAPGGPPYRLEAREDADCDAADAPAIGRRLQGLMTVPLYLTSWAGSFDPPSVLVTGEDGLPRAGGEAEVPFSVRIPCSLIRQPRAGHLLQYGHGILGSQDEIDTGWLHALSDRAGWILFAVDWTGMKRADAGYITQMVSQDISRFPIIPERLLQGFVEHLLAAEMMLGDLADDPALSEDGTRLVDTSALWFYGNSQGAVVGGAYVALSKRIRRAALCVGGMPFSLLTTRAQGFTPFFQILQSVFEDWADVSLSLPIMQMLWDEGESGGWAHLVTGRGVTEDTPTKSILIQAAIGDASVTTLGSHVMARAYGARLVEPYARPVWGLETKAPPFSGSALVEYDFGVEEPVESFVGDKRAGAHDRLRQERTSQDQVQAFFEEDVVRQTCDGACIFE